MDAFKSREESFMHEDDQRPAPEKSSGFANVLKLVFLAAVLIGAWFLLDWLINGK